MPNPPSVYTVGDFIGRVVDSLLRGECRGQRLCARCLVKLAKDHLDRSYSRADVTQVMDGIFANPGALTLEPSSVCALCARKKVPCLAAAPQS